MEIFVREKEEIFNLLENYSGLETLQCRFETSQRPILQTALKVKSLEQHDRELLEQLFEKAKKLVICEDEYATISIYGLKSIINELLKERGV